MKHFPAIERFLSGIGFRVERADVTGSFLPGIYVDGMRLLIDPERLSPGDLLHEAGHVAIIPSLFRDSVHGDVEETLSQVSGAYMANNPIWRRSDDGLPSEDPVIRGLLQAGEAEAIAWSYAAALSAGVPPGTVFFESAYEDSGDELAAALGVGAHLGVHGLAAAGMCKLREFPRMLRWLQV